MEGEQSVEGGLEVTVCVLDGERTEVDVLGLFYVLRGCYGGLKVVIGAVVGLMEDEDELEEEGGEEDDIGDADKPEDVFHVSNVCVSLFSCFVFDVYTAKEKKG